MEPRLAVLPGLTTYEGTLDTLICSPLADGLRWSDGVTSLDRGLNCYTTSHLTLGLNWCGGRTRKEVLDACLKIKSFVFNEFFTF